MKNVDFTRKIMTEDALRMIRSTILSKDMVAGSAVLNVVEDLIKLRSLSSTVVAAYNEDNSDDVRHGIEILRLIL